MKVAVTGAGGMIGGFLVKKLLDEGNEVLAIDIKQHEDWYQWFHKAENYSSDLTDPYSAKSLIYDVEQVYHLAADMGGIGHIESHISDCMDSVIITRNVLKACVLADVQKIFYSSSACAYNRNLQSTTETIFLKEDDAWPACPERGYGLEKLYGEELCLAYRDDYGLDCRIARFHNIFATHCTYRGGREKAPAALCAKVARAVLSDSNQIDIWGPGYQTRSFLYIDECLEGVSRLMASDYSMPMNIGSSETISIDDLALMIADIAGLEDPTLTHDLSAPVGVMGRSSDNTLIEKELGWKPSASLREGMERLYPWISEQILAEAEED